MGLSESWAGLFDLTSANKLDPQRNLQVRHVSNKSIIDLSSVQIIKVKHKAILPHSGGDCTCLYGVIFSLQYGNVILGTRFWSCHLYASIPRMRGGGGNPALWSLVVSGERVPPSPITGPVPGPAGGAGDR